MAGKELTIEELKAENEALKAQNLDLITASTQSAKDIESLTKSKSDLEEKVTGLTQEVGVAGDVVSELKKTIAGLEVANATSDSSKTVHKLGKKKYRLLYGVKLGGILVTDEALSGDEKLLSELVTSGSTAVQEVL